MKEAELEKQRLSHTISSLESTLALRETEHNQLRTELIEERRRLRSRVEEVRIITSETTISWSDL